MKKHTYTVNHQAKTITLTKDYAKRSSSPANKEFKELATLHASYPDYDIVRRTAEVSDSKNTHNGLSIEMMKKYIARLDNREEAEAEFERVQAYYGKEVEDKKNPGKTIIKAPYGKMKSWFLKKYPNYAEYDAA